MRVDELIERNDAAPDGDEDLFEMANLDKGDTGVDGFIKVRTMAASHGPSVKYYVKLGDGQPNFSVSIEANPTVKAAKGMSLIEVRKHAPAVIEWVKLNHVALLKFWFEGNNWTRKEVNRFFEGLPKVS